MTRRAQLPESYLAGVRPSRRQYEWQQLEFYGFLHFGMNTMTDREWGTGGEDPRLFDPAGVDADQWIRALKSAGMRGAILTAKHHDGFCLWPSRHTLHSVAASPWRDGRGDLVREVSDACARHGLKFGIYLSPWDRTEPSYGSGASYDDFYVSQLVELLTGYGELFTVWLDGANGEGPNGHRQVYDWERYYRVIRALQPGAAIAVCGPDVRWCGNEAGHTRADEWSVVPRSLQDAERTAEHSQQVDDPGFARLVRSDEEDLGSRTALAAAGAITGDLVWYPAEVNTSIRPGWFHHPAEDDQVRPASELFGIYQQAVGGNATFLLNVPPDRHGRIAAPDQAVLAELGGLIDDLHASVLSDIARLTSSSGVVDASGGLVRLAGEAGSWAPDTGDPAPWLEVDPGAPAWIDGVVLKEQIALGQRIERVEVEGWDGRQWHRLGRADSVGYQRILRFDRFLAERVRISVTRSRGRPLLVVACLLAAGTPRGVTA